MAPSTSVASVIVSLHPLVIMNISEHWTRVRAQLGKSTKVHGALLGRQKGRFIELCTSFEMKMDQSIDDEQREDIDIEFLNTSISQFKQVFADLDFLGWYTTGGHPCEQDIILHKQICTTINESPVLLKLDPFGKHTDLPVSVYESIIDIGTSNQATMLFIELEFTLATEEAERIGVDHIAKHSSSQAYNVQSEVADHLNCQYSAICLLNNRIKVIYEYVKAVRENKSIQKNNEILREIQSLCNRLPVMNSPNFYKEFYTLYNDVTWIAYLGVIMQGSNSLNQYLNKFLVMYDKTITKRGRGILI
jgi:COP9 signalosome complex subunit 6